MTDDFADREGLEMGDEYFANLDHIESVENFKEGYESEAHCSDSEGSGVDMSRIKIQPSALVSANPGGRPVKKGESKGERSRWSQRDRVIFAVFFSLDPSCHFILFLLHMIFYVLYLFMYFSTVTAQNPSSSGDSNEDDDKDSKSEAESDSSDDTFVKENYFSSSSVWRSYTTRGQVKGNKEGELVASSKP